VLDVEEAIVAGLEPAAVGQPALRSRIGRVDADVDDVGELQAPLAHDPEALMVPIRISDQVDRDIDAERAGELHRLEIAVERHALTEFAQPLFVDRLEAEKHRLEADALPQAEYLSVPLQHVAAGLEVVPLADAGPDDRLGDLHAVALVNERNVVDNEDAGLADRAQILDGALGPDQPVAAAVKGPGAAERAVPRAAARELDRGARVESAEKIFPPMAQQVAGRPQLVERVDKAGGRALARGGDGAEPRRCRLPRRAPRAEAVSRPRPRPLGRSRLPRRRARSAPSR
jgi:hypothetical protein